MNDHVALPTLTSRNLSVPDPYREWYDRYLRENGPRWNGGVITAAESVAGCLMETSLFGETRTDWPDLLDRFLTTEGRPLAYSELYGEKLAGFTAQRSQVDVYTVYARWWIDRCCGQTASSWRDLILMWMQESGWIYNPEVSPTNVRTRMRAELRMQAAMACEVALNEGFIEEFRPALCFALERSEPALYVSAEYFRLRAAMWLDRETDTGYEEIEALLERCEAGAGYSDFDVAEKIDDYMGVAKRSQRDIAVFSPLITLLGVWIERAIGLTKPTAGAVVKKLTEEPFGMPAYKMRDAAPDFGSGCTAYEVIAAVHLFNQD